MKVLKKSVSIILSLLMVISLFTIIPFESFAVENNKKTTGSYTVNGFTYDVNDKQATITKYEDKTISSVSIPEKLGGYPVVAISGDTFSGYTNLETIEIPESVLLIGDNAFNGCKSLEKIELPKNLTEIGSSAFENCTSLTEILIPKTLKSVTNSPWYGVFGGCNNLKKAEFEQGTETIPAYIMSDCTKLEEIIIPDSVTAIGSYAFNGCKSLEKIDFPKNLTEIGSSAFENCTSLTEILIPKTLKSVTNSPWYGVFGGCDNLKKAAFEQGTETIAGNVLRNCTKLEEIIIPDSVTAIGSYAFNGCKSLEKIELPKNLTEIGSSAFENCTSLTEILIPKTLKSVTNCDWNGVFGGCNNLKKAAFEQGTETITGSVLRNCTELEEIIIPDSVTTIGSDAFSGCVSLEKIELPKNLTNIGSSAFENCTSLTEILIPKTLKSVTNCDWNGVFGGCNNLKKAAFEQGTETITGSVLRNCTELEEIIIPDSVTTIGSDAFSGCVSLEKIELPKNLTNIGSSAFENCTSLTEILIPKTLKSVTNCDWNGVFGGCNNLKKAAFEQGTETITGSVLRNCTELEEIIIPDSVTTIGSDAFSGCVSLEKIELPKNLTNIGSSAFENCTSLTEILIPKTLKSVTNRDWNGVFGGCNNLKKAAFEQGTETITGSVLRNCTELEDVIIPDSVTKIGGNAFSGCKKLKTVFLPDNVITVADNAFSGCSEDFAVSCNKYSKAVINLIDYNIPFVCRTNKTKAAESGAVDVDNSYYSTVFSSTSNGGSISFTCSYQFNDEQFASLKNKKIKFKIPANSTLIEKTLIRDGDLCTDYSLKKDILSVTVEEKVGRITFSVKRGSNKNVLSYAIAEYSNNGTSTYDIIDVINDYVPSISVDTKSITDSEKFDVQGLAPAGNDVKIYIDDKYIDTVKTNKAGNYSANISLTNPEEGKKYIVKAETDVDGEPVSAVTNIQYSVSTPTMTSFTMTYNGKTYDMMSDVKHNITFAPSRIPTFKVKFTNSKNVMDVYISSERNNTAKRLKAAWDEKEKAYVATGYFDEDNHSYVPGKINVYYSEKGSYDEYFKSIDYDNDVYEECFKGAKAEVLKDTEDEKEIVITHKDGEKTTLISEKTSLEAGLKEILGEEKYAEYTAKKTTSAQSVDEKNKLTTGESSGDDFLYKFLKDAGKKVVKQFVVDGVEHVAVQDISEEDGDIYTYVIDTTGESIQKTTIKTVGKYIVTDYFREKAGEAVASEATKEIGGFYWSAGYGLYKAAKYDITTNLAIDEAKRNIDYSGRSAAEKEYLYKQLDDYRAEANAIAFMKAACSFTDAAVTLSGTGFTPQGIALKVGLFVVNDILLDMAEKNLDNRIKYLQGSPSDTSVNWAIDPSGFVYSGVMSNKLSGVKTTLYYIPYDEDDEHYWDEPDESKAEIWKAEDYSQENPLYTDDDGNYSWDVPEGWWRVKYELDGYETRYSDWMQVPPPQTDVNINMRNLNDPNSGEYIPGDVNDDGKVNMKDVTRLQKYINKWDVEIKEENSDVNGDNKITMKDIILLQKYINKWDVVLK